MLQKAVAATKDEADSLNARSFEYKRLKDEAEADRTLFDQLTAKVREAGVNAGYENSTIRVADLARPPAKPVWPNIPLAVSLAFVGSLLIGIASVITLELYNTTVRDPEQASRLLGIDVIGVLPSVRTRSLLTKSTGVRRIGEWNASALGSSRAKHQSPLTSYQEAIRTVRNTILLSDMDRPIRSVLVASAFPKEGKSTTAINLALAHAEQGRRALIIDADLRRPVIHKRLDISSEHGLADVLQGRMNWMQLVQNAPEHENVDVLPAGQAQSRPADLMGSAITQLLNQASASYDLVIIDAPPTLGFAESLQIATTVDGVIVVAKAGKTNRKAVATVLTFLRRVRANVLGVVLNQYESKMGADHYSYGYYGYYGTGKMIDATPTTTKA
jgi:capsular exopolysaccharide synthesis family protein